MGLSADLGTHILTSIPSFHNHTKTIEDIIHQTIERVFLYFGIETIFLTEAGVNSRGRRQIALLITTPRPISP